jgi:hypothetical protein
VLSVYCLSVQSEAFELFFLVRAAGWRSAALQVYGGGCSVLHKSCKSLKSNKQQITNKFVVQLSDKIRFFDHSFSQLSRMVRRAQKNEFSNFFKFIVFFFFIHE